ncbi:MAG: glycosyltransferase family 4 protein [Candidatus Eremiobacteraeota bacterium]|nr:glycosyltransferase family 4 protein [Candidatus Eremiobacteraeota bacterium]
MLVMTAAHGGYDSDQVPLGGGAAVCERLRALWPSVCLIGSGPGADIRVGGLDSTLPSSLNELEYARFSRRFEQEATEAILAMRPLPVVLSHDISEGPSFARLAQAGVDCLAILHVDVVDYFQRFYLGDVVSPSSWAWLHRVTRSLVKWPDLLQLVFEKQYQAAAHCRYLVVPSARMKGILEAEYPFMPGGRVRVVPWGAPLTSAAGVEAAKEQLRSEWGPGPYVLTMSRIAPEKGQDLLLRHYDGKIIIAGAPSYMLGQRYMRKLERLAQGRPVIFPGHLGGAMKRAALELASVFVVGSRHESYGLTIVEAMAAGCPVVGLRSYGVEATVEPAWGRIVEDGPALGAAVRELLADEKLRSAMGAVARERAAASGFTAAAEELWRLCQGSHVGGR